MARAKTARGRGGPPLALIGPVTFSEVVRLREAILAELLPDGDLRIDLSVSGPWDLAGLQLILSAVEFVRRSGRRVILESIPDAFRVVAESASATEFLDGVAAGIADRPVSP